MITCQSVNFINNVLFQVLIYLKRTLSKGESTGPDPGSVNPNPGSGPVLLALVLVVFRGFVSGAGVQTDCFETLYPLPDRDQRPEAAAGTAQVSDHTCQSHLYLV